jgi:hypothetical protein
MLAMAIVNGFIHITDLLVLKMRRSVPGSISDLSAANVARARRPVLKHARLNREIFRRQGATGSAIAVCRRNLSRRIS